MKNSLFKKIGLAAAICLVATTAHAHFQLNAPASWIEEDDRGDPQKLAPCGGTLADGGTRTGAVTEVRGGDMLRLAIEETIYHPGHYRVALVRNMNSLPADAEPLNMVETPRGLGSGRFPIEANPEAPVLLDGLWENSERRTGPLETEIRIPNIDCENCVLQIVQFMSEHPGHREGGYTYHHCSMLDITANPSMAADEGW
ncbi:hypothetical protein JYT97_02145 [Haliea sp. AH-315-K21]|uniref:Chitin-binding type-4 domain-containing protein n=1 Tax=SAR86 cluster bacterium TaxID=2030880 RepID=A0A2A5CE60_9GAMM|nr:hypothetical protein [Haliea sp. AH-315-K21]MBN4075742.1 hypothetical protein [Gammaproteobacteria bacterium AH-315-E17]PCJ42052.1 MAG: hypothetical protein COA71_05520 [SAR86 cluster bacterium]